MEQTTKKLYIVEHAEQREDKSHSRKGKMFKGSYYCSVLFLITCIMIQNRYVHFKSALDLLFI